MEKYAWPGGYEQFAITDDGDVLCADCVNNPSNPTHEGGDADGWRIEGYDSMGNTDDEPVCGHCGREIGI